MTAWLIRAGSKGEREDFALETGVAGTGFSEVGDLSMATSRDLVLELVNVAYPRRQREGCVELRRTAQCAAEPGSPR